MHFWKQQRTRKTKNVLPLKKVREGDDKTLRKKNKPMGTNHQYNMNSIHYIGCIYNVHKCNKKNVHRVRGNRNSVIGGRR